MGYGPKDQSLDLAGDLDHDPDPGFADADHNLDPGFLKNSLFTAAIPTESQE